MTDFLVSLYFNSYALNQKTNKAMHTILGANGIIGEELAKELRKNYTPNIKLVGRNPQKVHEADVLCKADLLDIESTKAALADTEIAYLTVGLPYDSTVWLRDWPIVLKNVIEGCKANNCKLVYFDNTYAYAQEVGLQTENSPFEPSGKKGEGKKIAAELLLAAIDKKEIEALICVAPEFYGPGKTKSITNAILFGSIKQGKKPRLFLTDQTLRTLIYTPDASRAMALLANTSDAYGHTWHLPCDDGRMTYREFIGEISQQLGRNIEYSVMGSMALKAAALANKNLKETQELFPRYEVDNIFKSSKFKARFPDFKVTTYKEGISTILAEMP